MTDATSGGVLEAEMNAVAELFDAEFYAAANPLVAHRMDDLLRHFCVYGWRELRKPRRDFDVWWYWANHLDPTSDEVNPLVHYAQIGRAAGLSTRPPDPGGAGPGASVPSDRPVRRVCLFAGFDAEGVVDEAALIYLRELARHTDVYCLYDCYLSESELAKVRQIAVEAWAIRHGAYDFGSYSMLAADLVGWDRLAEYDEVLFVNDSCYLLRPLDDVFARMDAQSCDWWGLQATKGTIQTRDAASNSFTDPIPLAEVQTGLLADFEDDAAYDFHVGSYFLAFRRPVVLDERFRRLVESITKQKSKRAIVYMYEIGLTHLLIGRGYSFSTFIPNLYPLHPIFTDWAFELIASGFPLLKRYFLYQNHYDTAGLARWRERVAELVPDAPLDVFEENLRRTAPDDRLQRSYAIERSEDGSVRVPEVLTGSAFTRADKQAAKNDDWWVFAVDPETHLLPENSRAIFQRVADDPTITKIILTRSRRLELPGENVLSAPVLSPQGRDLLLRAGVVFVGSDPVSTLGVRVSPSLHHVIAVRGSLMLLRHGRTAGAPRQPRTEPRPPAEGTLQMLHKATKPAIGAVLTASDLDQVAEVAAQWPVRYASGWRTGLPAHDHLLTDQLPPDLARQEENLRTLAGDRRLVLFAPASRPQSAASVSAAPFDTAEVEKLAGWAAEYGAVIGVRDPSGDLRRPVAAAFGDLAIDVSPIRFASMTTVLRSTSVLVTDYSGYALDFTLTGRPVVCFARDLDAMTEHLLYDLDHVFPGPICRQVDELVAALQSVFDPPSAAVIRQYRRVRDLFIEHRDGRNTERVLDNVHSLLERSIR